MMVAQHRTEEISTPYAGQIVPARLQPVDQRAPFARRIELVAQDFETSLAGTGPLGFVFVESNRSFGERVRRFGDQAAPITVPAHRFRADARGYAGGPGEHRVRCILSRRPPPAKRFPNR